MVTHSGGGRETEGGKSGKVKSQSEMKNMIFVYLCSH